MGAVLYALGSLAIFWVLGYLFRAIRGRRPGLPQFALVLAAVGAVGYGLGRAVAEIARYVGAHDFVSPQTSRTPRRPTRSARRRLSSDRSSGRPRRSRSASRSCSSRLNAMRVGLLTRFMGVLGIIVGVTFAPILPLDQQGIIRVFWLAALGRAVRSAAGRAASPRRGRPGEAEPWPTQQQLREQRDAARARAPRRGATRARSRARAGAAPPTAAAQGAEPAPSRPAAAGTEHSASKKKKRKRRA